MPTIIIVCNVYSVGKLEPVPSTSVIEPLSQHSVVHKIMVEKTGNDD